MNRDVETVREQVNGKLELSPKTANKIPQYVAAIIVNISSLCSGLLLGWPSVVIPTLQSADSPIIGGPMSNEEVSYIASIVPLVAIFGTLFVNPVRSRCGNKITGYMIGIAFAINWIIIIVTNNKVWIYVARGLAGMAASWNFILCPQYVSEIAEDSHRGTLGVFFMMFFNIGYLLIYGIAALFSYRGIAIVCLIPSLLFLFLFAWMPESPSNLLIRGKDLESGNSMQWLRGKNVNIAEELNKLKATVTMTSESTTMSFREMISDYGTRRGLIIVVMLCLNNQFDGIYIILSYLGIILLETGSDLSHIAASAIVGTLQVIGTILSSYLVDRKGRRFLLIVSNITVSICLAVLGAFFYLKHLEIDVSNVGWLPVTSLSVYMVGIAIGVSPLPFLVITEVCLPAASKSASTLGYCILWILSFVMANFFITLSDIIGVYSCFWFLSLACIVCALFTYFVVPETKGRPIQDIYSELSRK